MACYVYDINGILNECLKSREDKELIRDFTVIYDSIVKHSLTPTVQFLDNECPPPRPYSIHEEKKIDFQLVPPHDH